MRDMGGEICEIRLKNLLRTAQKDMSIAVLPSRDFGRLDNTDLYESDKFWIGN